ncbi:DUF3291 domain-containing protein [Marinibaculum pumilum]|uniref:DUF3291 domain-containing protein n=1 Tax=Marinibaculum pumilum TaxID=1766165 RepID=A0ABV7KXN7_9PROT
MGAWQIAQLNVGHVLYPVEDPRMAGFTDRLDEINALADAAPGFVWRLQSDSGNATDILVSDDPSFLVNMSVWENVEDLFRFVYRTAHQGVMAGRRQWFARPDGPYQVLWWVPAGHRPTAEEALERLKLLEREGPSPFAFTFKKAFPPPGEAGTEPAGRPSDLEPDPWCVGWQ